MFCSYFRSSGSVSGYPHCFATTSFMSHRNKIVIFYFCGCCDCCVWLSVSTPHKEGETNGQPDPTSSCFCGLDPKQALWFFNRIYKVCFSFSVSVLYSLLSLCLSRSPSLLASWVKVSSVTDRASKGNLKTTVKPSSWTNA